MHIKAFRKGDGDEVVLQVSQFKWTKSIGKAYVTHNMNVVLSVVTLHHRDLTPNRKAKVVPFPDSSQHVSLL